MSDLPSVQVRDLPPAASFYSAVCQPLGLRFLSANSTSIVFGNSSSNPGPVFEVNAAPPTRPTRMILSVSSPSVVSAFHAAARRANPTGKSYILLCDGKGQGGGESRATATDLEGNMIEVVCKPGPFAATRILHWNLDVVTTPDIPRSVVGSAGPSPPAMSVAPSLDEGIYTYFKRSLTMTTVETSPAQEPQNSKGVGTGTMIGAVLGAVAAGAAVGAGITYALSKNDRNRAPRQEVDAPSLQRRATYPEPYPDQRPYYIERAVERVHYPERYPGNHAPACQTPQPPRPAGPVVEVDDHASRHTTRPHTRSAQKPLMITDAERRSNAGTELRKAEADGGSQAGSRYTNARSRAPLETGDDRSQAGSRHTSRSTAPPQRPDQRSHVSTRSRQRGTDAETYVSARSQKSASTVRPAKACSVSPSQYSSVTSKPRAPSKANWDGIDDSASVEPSDSISCVGERPTPHPRDIPFLQTRERLIIQ
ncbi:hypothetical protein F5Y17DRAFT_226014 [Xylariaceae sp. FL0594]|nr:hypothetical protein F5Y17DRAFT_226014 [Xylariaceae sp. FL0594]